VLDDSYLTKVGDKGIASIKAASEKRMRNDLIVYLNSQPEIVRVHAECRKTFIDTRSLTGANVKSSQLKGEDVADIHKKLRSTTPAFNWKDMCLFCGGGILTEKASYRRNVETREIKQTIVTKCDERADPWGILVKGRLESCNDLPAEEAVYHAHCHTRFMNCLPMLGCFDSDKLGRPKDPERLKSFHDLCEWLDTKAENMMYTLEDLQKYMGGCSDSGSVYTTKHLKRKLDEHYGDHLYTANVCGRKSVLCFRNMCSYIINDTWYQAKAKNAVDESERIVKAAARLIYAELRDLPDNNQSYPTAHDITDEAKNQLPPLLGAFMETVVTSKLKQSAIGQSLIQAARPRGIICPIPFGLGVEMDHVFGSKFLLSELARLGFCISYDEVVRYKQSVMSTISAGDTGNESLSEAAFTQWVADNVDHNVRTLDGLGTFHGMGIISSSVFKRSHTFNTQTPVKRLTHRLPVAQVVQNKGIPVVTYSSEAKSGLCNLTLASVQELQRPLVLPAICNLDLVWHASYFMTGLNDVCRPNWSGFMQSTCFGEHDPAAVVTFLPIIDLNPSDENCIYSTLLFVDQQAAKLNVQVPCITFDQPLWLKAVEIVRACKLRIVVRLGGFHTLMSFLGSLGVVMSGSGIEEIFQLIYGPDTVGHMMSGKAVARAIRGHFLLDSALRILLLTNIIQPDANDSSSCDGQNITVDAAHMQQLDIGQSENVEQEADSMVPTILPEDVASIMNLCEDVHHDKFSVDDSNLQKFECLRKLEHHLRQMKIDLCSKSRTAKLWFQYMGKVDTIKQFLIAERTGNWELHLESVREMLNIFAATGHNNYAKCARLYIQLMVNLTQDSTSWLYGKFADERLHSIRRSDRYWGGLSTDLVIEQTLMRSLKSRGGLTRGRGVEESVRTVWVHTMHQSAAIHLAMTSKTGLQTPCVEHADVGTARTRRDAHDLEKIIDWLRLHNPFVSSDGMLRCLSSGVTACDADGVNCDLAETIGASIHSKLDEEKGSSSHVVFPAEALHCWETPINGRLEQLVS